MMGPVSLDLVGTTGPLTPGRGARACGQLNSKAVQIFSKAGEDWNTIEVRPIRLHKTVYQRHPLIGPELKQDRIFKIRCIRAGSVTLPRNWSVAVETDLGVAGYQSRRHIRRLESVREQVRCF